MICAYGPEPHLAEVVAAIRASEGARRGDRGRQRQPACAGLDPEVVVLEPGENTGFARGCNLGVQAASGSTVVFVNSDAFVEPDCLALLHGELSDPAVALAGRRFCWQTSPGSSTPGVTRCTWSGSPGPAATATTCQKRSAVNGPACPVPYSLRAGRCTCGWAEWTGVFHVRRGRRSVAACQAGRR